MNKELHIAETEWKVMKVLWEKPLKTIGEISAALHHTGWSYSTIKTLVRRLTDKGALGINKELSQFRYYPCVDETECKIKETKNFINRIYNGSVKMLITGLAAESNLSREEISELMRLINKLEESEKK